MKKVWIPVVLVCVVLLSGCAAAERGREPENTVLAQVVGIDRMGDVWLVSAAGKDGSGETVFQTAQGTTLAAAFDGVSGAGEIWLSVTGVSSFLLGDGVEPEETLLYIVDDSGMSWRASVWCAPIAAALMEGQEGGGADRLTVLEQAGTERISVVDALVDLKECGTTAIPALIVRDGKLETSGKIYYGRKGGE